MKETSSIKERLIENMKEEYPLNVAYIKSYLPNYGLPVMGVFLSNGFPEYVNLEDGPKKVDQAVMYIDVESLKTILNGTDEVSVSDAVFMDGIIRFLKYYRPVSLVYRKSGMTDGKVLLNILERLFEICPPIAPLQDIKAATSALIYERDDEAVRAAYFKAPIGVMIRQGTRQITEKLYRLKGKKVYGNITYTERPYLPDYDFITIEKRSEVRPIDTLIVVDTNGFLEKASGYYRGEGNIGDLILIFSLLCSFAQDDSPTVEDEVETADEVKEGSWRVPSNEADDYDENYDGFDEDDYDDEDDEDEDEKDSDAEYVDCPVTMIVRIKKSDADNLGRIENHIEEFVDLDSWPEIDSIYGVTVTSPELYQLMKAQELDNSTPNNGIAFESILKEIKDSEN